MRQGCVLRAGSGLTREQVWSARGRVKQAGDRQAVCGRGKSVSGRVAAERASCEPLWGRAGLLGVESSEKVRTSSLPHYQEAWL